MRDGGWRCDGVVDAQDSCRELLSIAELLFRGRRPRRHSMSMADVILRMLRAGRRGRVIVFWVVAAWAWVRRLYLPVR